MRKTVFLALAAPLVMAGCATWETSNLPREVKQAPVAANVAPSQILVTEDSLSGRSFEPLADLKVTVNKTTAFHPAPTREAVIEKLRVDAAKLGADAVISVAITDVEVTPFSWGTRTGTGKAVKLAQ